MAGPSGRTVAALQALIAAVLVAHIAAVAYVVDDSFISFEYAEHLAGGQGLVYNIGERVEGFTNFLWVILLAGWRTVWPSSDMLVAARIFATAAAVLVLILMFRLSAVLTGGPAVGLLAGALFAADASVAAWSGSGLETTFFALLVFGGLAAAPVVRPAARGWLTGGLFALAAMTRPEGVLIFGLAFAALSMWSWHRGGWSGVLARIWPPAVVFLMLWGTYFVWRYQYYGDLFPNTAYAKVGLSLSQLTRGLRYVAEYVTGYGVFWWLLPVAVYVLRQRQWWVWTFASIIAVYLAYVVYVGGDGLAFHRFIVHVAPMMYFVAAAAMVSAYSTYLAPRVSRWPRVLVATAAVTVLVASGSQATMRPLFAPATVRWTEAQSGLSFPGTGTTHRYVWFDNYFVDRLAIAARYLDTHAVPGSLVASTPAGAVAYYMKHPVIDMLGLTDRHIARTKDVFQNGWRYGRAGHEKGDGAYVLSRDPDYILMGNVAVLPYPLDDSMLPAKLVLKSEHELWELPAFHERYELVTVQLSETGPFRFFSFYRKRE